MECDTLKEDEKICNELFKEIEESDSESENESEPRKRKIDFIKYEAEGSD